MESVVLFQFLFGLLWIAWSINLARRFNRDKLIWVMMAFFLGPFSVLLLYILGPKEGSFMGEMKAAFKEGVEEARAAQAEKEQQQELPKATEKRGPASNKWREQLGVNPNLKGGV